MNELISAKEKVLPKKGLTLCALFAGVAGLGFVPILVRLSDMGAYAIGFWRLTLSLPVLLIMIYKHHSAPAIAKFRIKSIRLKDYFLMLLMGVLFGINLISWHLSIQYTAIANAVILSNLAPVLVVAWSLIVLNNPSSWKGVTGILITFMGVIIVIGPHHALNTRHLWGIFFGLTTAIIYAVYLLMIVNVRKRVDTLKVVAIVSFAGAVTLFCLSLYSGETLLISSSREFYLLLGLAVISQVFGQCLITYAVAHVIPTFYFSSLLVEPVIATVAAWILFTEALSLAQMIGIAIALSGIYLTRSI